MDTNIQNLLLLEVGGWNRWRDWNKFLFKIINEIVSGSNNFFFFVKTKKCRNTQQNCSTGYNIMYFNINYLMILFVLLCSFSAEGTFSFVFSVCYEQPRRIGTVSLVILCKYAYKLA